MKRLIIAAVIVAMALAALFIVGCSNKDLVGPSPDEDQTVVNSCATCHTDKDTLKALAVEEEVVTSEETSGEG